MDGTKSLQMTIFTNILLFLEIIESGNREFVTENVKREKAEFEYVFIYSI